MKPVHERADVKVSGYRAYDVGVLFDGMPDYPWLSQDRDRAAAIYRPAMRQLDGVE